jgi:hypothetical protein
VRDGTATPSAFEPQAARIDHRGERLEPKRIRLHVVADDVDRAEPASPRRSVLLWIAGCRHMRKTEDRSQSSLLTVSMGASTSGFWLTDVPHEPRRR